MKTFNVLIFDINRNKIVPYNIIPYLTKCYYERYNLSLDYPKTFEEFKEFIKKESRHRWWARCEYEIIISEWPPHNNLKDDRREKWDVYQQIMMNLEVITKLLIDSIHIENCSNL